MPHTFDVVKDTRIDDAAGLATARGRPELGDFLRVFLARGAGEDIAPYTPAELVALADAAMQDLGVRSIGKHRVSVFSPDHGIAGDAHHGITVIEILNDDMPFLVDSVMQELTDTGVDVRLLVHPILSVLRDPEGNLLGFAEPGARGSIRESLIHIHIARLQDGGDADALSSRLDLVLRDVRAAVQHWPAMRKLVTDLITDYRENPPPLPVDEIAEAIEFLTWLSEDNFTFLGIREYDVNMGAESEMGQIALRADSGLGLLRDPDVRILRRGKDLVQVTPEIREFLRRPEALIVTKANVKSRVHRHAYMDYVGVKRYDADGHLTGEIRLVGLFTSTAYTRSTRAIPFLRHKVSRIMDRAGFTPGSHSGKSLLNVLESYPRDDLFQIDQDKLYAFAIAILELDERPRIRVLARRDKFDRFVSVLVYVPRDRYSTEIRFKIGEYLRTVYQGRMSAFYPHFPEGSLTRIHFIIGRDEGATPDPAQAELEAAVTAIVRNWVDAFQETVRAAFPAAKASSVVQRWASAFPPAYRDIYSAADALNDVAAVERLSNDRRTTIAFRRPRGAEANALSLKLFNRGGAVPLSQRVPILEAMGFQVIDEQTFQIGEADPVVLHDMHLTTGAGAPVDLSALDAPLKALFMAVWTGETESDRLNALILTAGLAWREIAILRALSRYLQQARIPYEQGYIADTLNRHPDIAARIVALFHTRFDPADFGDRAVAEAQAATDIETALEAVTSLDDDVILRRLMNLVQATNRTTFYQLGPDGRPRQVLAFKLDPHSVTDLPEPKPYAEIWVYSPRIEGVHLRFGPVARGGLRWSDRPQDFRTEVLGLVKAQQVKNAVIVPVGAKGGFFPKKLPAGGNRDAIFQEGTQAYKIFVSTLLDLTDNIDGDAIVPPDNTVRHDGDDPYLVVAADKGTATFSDTANGISDEHGFWLSDAFASGGSAGYDHKKMGITARGGWEAVKRHFREIDIDIQATPFTVAGVGDMSGDVFGNGMLLSPVIRLVAAFDHRDIFLDPDPDPAVGLAERQRLFDMPRSSWADYDTAAISAGGGVFSRSSKAISLSPEAQALLGLTRTRATPQEVMSAILKAPVDLLWFGGIGTYVRAEDETDAEAGDRANDAIRVVAHDVRARVIGEGANLGLTQKARIAYGLAGGRCNSDAVDNSAGVNSSDVEVNIKIALRRAVREGRLDIADRNVLLASMTPEVARLVLANNYRQTLCVSLVERLGFTDFGYQQRLMQWLEGRGLLDRAVEVLPDDAALARREKAGQPLTRSEIGVLMAYAKIVLFDDIVATSVPDETYLEDDLVRYFPIEMQQAYAEDIRAHRLRREIVATVIANQMINRGGPTYAIRMADQSGAGMGDIARAYLVATEAFDLGRIEAAIDALDNQIPGKTQLALYGRVQDLLLGASLWFLRNAALGEDLDATIRRFHAGIAAYRTWMGERTADTSAAADTAELAAAGIPHDLARRIAGLPMERNALDVILVAETADRPIATAAGASADVAVAFRFEAIDRLARTLQPRDYFDGLALDRARRTLAEAQRRITTAVARDGDGGVENWLHPRRSEVERTLGTIGGLLQGEPTVARFTVAAGLLGDLAAT
ncbi:MAG TPA: NAD-glutamate dehydrogenase [Methylomirabilota bacterium]|nr:NAD-glutamate dehydrogenase [Methylomirabilota bacterium]